MRRGHLCSTSGAWPSVDCRCPGGTDGGCRADRQPNAPLRSGHRRHRQLRPCEAPRVGELIRFASNRVSLVRSRVGTLTLQAKRPHGRASGGAAAPQIACCREAVGHDWAGDDGVGRKTASMSGTLRAERAVAVRRALGRRLADRDELWGGKARGVAADAGIARPDACSASRRPAPLRSGQRLECAAGDHRSAGPCQRHACQDSARHRRAEHRRRVGPLDRTDETSPLVHRARRTSRPCGCSSTPARGSGPAASLRSGANSTERCAGRRPRRAPHGLAALHRPPVGALPGAQAGRRLARELRRRDGECLAFTWLLRHVLVAGPLAALVGRYRHQPAGHRRHDHDRRAEGRRYPARAGSQHPVGEAQRLLVAGAAHRRRSTDPNAIPEGARFRLDPTARHRRAQPAADDADDGRWPPSATA